MAYTLCRGSSYQWRWGFVCMKTDKKFVADKEFVSGGSVVSRGWDTNVSNML